MSAMDKNSVPPKTKPPPSESSDEESGSSEDVTEDEEQAERGSGFESGSDESTDTTKKKLINILPLKQQSAVKAAGPPASPAKRTREANGKKEKVEEPSNKKKKIEVATPTPKATPRPAAPQSDKKSVLKAEKSKPIPAKEKQLKDSAEKDTKKSAMKRTIPASAASAAKPTASKSEDDAAQKPKMDVRHWSHDEELALSREIQRDRVDDVYGSSLPAARSDPYWDNLMSRLPFVNQYEEDLRKERLCEKVRRMRLRYESLNTRLKAGETSVYKNAHEGVLWRIWHTIWGPNKATPSMLNGDDEEDEMEEDEESGSEDDGSDEDEEEEISPTQGKGRPSAVVGKATALQKAIGKKVMADDSSSDDDDSNDEDSPVKATPPAVQATPATAARKPTPAPKPVATRDPASTAMDLASSGRNSSQRNGGQSNHAIIPALLEKSVRPSALPKVSDEMRAENLALLRDMRGTCVKMVEEAKSQSLHITEKMLDDTRVKATQIVEEAKLKSAEIMEELRLFLERINGGPNGRNNGSHRGSWNDFNDDPFQGTGLRLGSPIAPIVLGDPNLDSKWREQSEAEQGLLLQRLQLVQEQARIYQEGIRLRISHQKQLAFQQQEERTES